MTETSATVSIYPVEAPALAAPGKSGVLLGGTEAIVVEPATGEPLAPGSEGEIRVRGPKR